MSMRIFTITHRVSGVENYLRDLACVATLSETYGFTGVLLFSDNSTQVDPWMAAAELLRQTKTISPLVAANPTYMHPFAAAKMIASLTHLYERRIYLNMITGTALSHLEAIGDRLSHDERYGRLLEYIIIGKHLLESQKPLRYEGAYYKVNDLLLPAGIAKKYMPEFFMAGRSEAARDICQKTGSTGIQMLSANLADGIQNTSGLHFGIVTRPTEQEAWEAARSLYRSSAEDQEIMLYSMQNTDSSWKRKMRQELEQAPSGKKEFWLEPFANAAADCPFLVGSYSAIAKQLKEFSERGITTLIIDIAASEAEFFHASCALREAGMAISGG
jgi:alkanesulfonate monooxygenase